MKALRLRAQRCPASPPPGWPVGCSARGAGAGVGPLRLRRHRPARPARARTGSTSGPAWRASAAPTWPPSTARQLALLRAHRVSFPFVPGHEVVGRLAEGTGHGTVRRQPGRARAGARLRRPRHRSAVCPACAEGDTGQLRAHRLRRTSSPACRPGSAPTPAAAGRRRLVAHASQLHAVPDDADRRGRGDGRADRLRRPRRARRRRGRRRRRWSCIGAGHPRAAARVAALRPPRPRPARSSVGGQAPRPARARPTRSAPTTVVAPDELAPGRARASRHRWSSATATSTAHRRRRRGPRLRRQRRESLAEALAVVRPRGPGRAGRHAGPGPRRPHRRCGTARSPWPAPTPTAPRRLRRRRAPSRTFDLAFDLVAAAGLGPPRVGHLPARPLRRRHRPRRRRRPPRRGQGRLRPPRPRKERTR